MPRFEFVPAHTIEEALQLLDEPGIVSRPLAGGTDLLVYVRQAPPPFDRLVDISMISELKRIYQDGDTVSVGAGVTFTEAAASDLLARHARCLVEACESVGGPQIRNSGTLGGNVVNAAACADSLPALICLDAVAHLRSRTGERAVPVAELVQGPKRCALSPGELLTRFSFTVQPEGTRSTFIKLGRRNAQAISRLSMAALGRIGEAARIELVHLVPGAAVPQTRRFAEAEAMLAGRVPSAALITAAAAASAAEMVARAGRRWSTEYKELAIQALAERALRRVLLNGASDGEAEIISHSGQEAQ
jgi:CO/xanthine dehydrogenase FAD-binding subunit